MSLLEALRTDPATLAGDALEPVEVAIVDSGIDGSHPDLAGRVVAAFAVDVEKGRPVVSPRAVGENNDAFGHGTGVGSIIARLAPNARLVDVRVLGKSNTGTADALLAGFRHAVDRGARVINMSLASKAKFAEALHDICELAYRKSCIVVAAKRNMPLTDLGFPAELSATISVDRRELPSPYALRFFRDEVIEFAAHGDRVPVAAAGGGYTTMTGTSFATPAVSAVCALLLGRHPELRPFEVKAALKALADRATDR